MVAYHNNAHGNKLVKMDDPNDWFWKIVYVATQDVNGQEIIRLENQLMDDYNTILERV